MKIILGGGTISDALGSAASGAIAGALTGATAVGAIIFGASGTAAAVVAGAGYNIVASLVDTTSILNTDAPQGYSNLLNNSGSPSCP